MEISIEYLEENFDSLPPEVVEVIVGSLDREDLLSLCLSNKKFLAYCKGLDWLNKRLIEFIEEEAPLSGSYSTLAEQANLIKRGFKTCYTGVHHTAEVGGVTDLRFGSTQLNREDGHFDGGPDFPINFSIVGLPPARGTRVWLRVIGPRFFSIDALVFVTKHEAIYVNANFNNDPFAPFLDEEQDDGVLDQIYADLNDNGWVEFEGDFMGVIEVVLP
jgi:hypothetical protein